MKLRWIGFTFIVICMLIGLLAGFFSHSIEAALTVPLNIRASQATSTSSKMGPGSPVGTAKPSMPSTPTAGGVTILAQDTFKRANQVFWGTASDGRQWASDANSIEVFSVVSGAGQIDHAQGTFNAILGPVNTNAEVVFSGIVNQFTQGGTVNMGALLRWTDANNWYKALIDGSKLQILRRVNGKTTDGYYALKRRGRLAFPDAERCGHQGELVSRDNGGEDDLGRRLYYLLSSHLIHMKAERHDE